MEPAKPPQEQTWSFSFSVTRQDPDGSGGTDLSWMRRLRVIDLIFLLAALTVFVLEPLALYVYINKRLDDVNAACGPVRNLLTMPSEQGHYGTNDPVIGFQGDVITPLNARDPASLVMGAMYDPPPAASVEAPPPPSDEDWRQVLESAKTGSVQKAKRAEPKDESP